MQVRFVQPFREFETALQEYCVNDFSRDVSKQYLNDIDDMAQSIDTIRSRLSIIEKTFIEMADGDFTRLESFRQIGKRSAKDQLMPAVVRMMESVLYAIDEANRLSGAVISGDLTARSDTTQLKGRYKELMDGLNGIMDAMAQPLQENISVLGTMAQNDYTTVVETEYNGSFAELSHSVNKVNETLNRVMRDINRAAEQVADGTRQVSDGSQHLSQGATEQASAIEELTSTLGDIATQTKNNAMNANKASQLANQVSQFKLSLKNKS